MVPRRIRTGREECEAPVGRAQIAELYELQLLDLEIDRSATEAESLRRSLAEDATRPTREAAARARARAERARRETGEAELALREAETRITKQEARLYGGGTAVRDLGALQTELGHLQTAHAAQEERVLALMLAAEEAQAAATQAAESHAAAERVWVLRRDELRLRLSQMESALAELRAQRDARTATIDAEALRRYDDLRRAHAGRAVALVREGTCQACRVVLPSGVLQRARAGAELVPCNHCGRILYVR
jgi:predicted  nucleic acid-binding Zn-ribbon protein